jgi:cell wall-associated NlpC family hydrolase
MSVQEETVAQGIVANARWGVEHKAQIHYAQTRPIDGINHPHKLPLTTDCSGFVTDCFKWAGAPDPNGRHYDGYGYTGTMLSACVHIDRSQTRPGDLVVFGPGTGEHVVIIVGTGSDPAVVSHGQEAGPIQLSLSAEAGYHARPLTFLSATRRRTEYEPEPVDDVASSSNPPTEEGMTSDE